MLVAMSVWRDLREGRLALDYREMLERVRREKLAIKQQLEYLDERERVLLEWIEHDEQLPQRSSS
jgi:hypothetical protein